MLQNQPEDIGYAENHPPASLFGDTTLFGHLPDDQEEAESSNSSDPPVPAVSAVALASLGPEDQFLLHQAGYSVAGPLEDPDTEGWDEAQLEAHLEALEDMDALGDTPFTWIRRDPNSDATRTHGSDAHKQSKAQVSKPKQEKETFEEVDGNDVALALKDQRAVAVILYRNDSSVHPRANDVWPTLRDITKLPARYHRVDKTLKRQLSVKSQHRSSKAQKMHQLSKATAAHPSNTSSMRPIWGLPVELIEMIAEHLNRDDIKSLRLVSRELNQNVSQVLFKTVVVPFNTEIYGMLGQEQDLDLKGKKKAGASNFVWKNANGDDVYNGHGLDVFRGFGAHITKFGMSFEVTEDALANPPIKLLTDHHVSFWGTYEWPFVEYRRFEDVAGLESAADETPRMKTAFSELTKVQELALSVDSGLGWLNGPDRSIRARILQRPPAVFGTLKKIPDRRTHAQQELWQYIKACHGEAGSDLTSATLYRLEANQTPSNVQMNSLALNDQPELPFVEPRIISEALPHDTTDLMLPISFDDPETLDRFVAPHKPTAAGILYTSKIQPMDPGQLLNSVIPSTLTKAQKEWLMETEWAQRAFISSYMLSVIDNPKTFSSVHTLNISRLSDRYIPLLDREDFWAALPNLSNIILLVLPCWRTISNDETGAVDTPPISPTQEINSVVSLLKRIVHGRPGVKNLTVGWASGGEHAEGMHARNKLLLPAPLLNRDMATSQNAASLRDALLRFPHVERLTLKNCWINPMALQEFVELHDSLGLKHLVLDSVSSTGVLRPRQNLQLAVQMQAVQQAQNLGGNAWAPGLQQAQALHAHALAVQANGLGQGQGQQHNIMNPVQFFQTQFQLLQIQLQQVQNLPGGNANQIQALQLQLQHLATHGPGQLANANNGNANQLQIHGPLMHTVQQVLQNHGQWPQGQAGGQEAVATAATANQTLLTAQPREGSWVDIIDIITPGPNLRDFGSEFSKANEERITSLKTIEFISCGYARLPYSHLDQVGLEDMVGTTRQRTDPTFVKRVATLLPSMLNSKGLLLGEIVQEMRADELATLYAGWSLEAGWRNEEEASAVEFDGLMPGGTGRFSGTVSADDRLVLDE